MKKSISGLLWLLLSLAGAGAYAVLAGQRGAPVNSAYLLIAAVCTYAIGYRFYSKWIAVRVLMLDDRRATPCEVNDDGRDFVKTNRFIVFGHHFAAISGPGPLVGPVLAAQFGYLPGAIWILIGVVLGGAVQDFVILFCSLRRNGKSLGQMVKEELNPVAGAFAVTAILAIMIILLAVLGLVVVKALAESPWGVFTVGATIPIAMFMGGYLRYVRVGKVLEASVLGVVLLLLAVWGGQFVHGDPHWAGLFTLTAPQLAWGIIGYGVAASVLPVWLLLAPRDYLSTFMKLGTILALAIGVFLVLPALKMPAITKFIDGSGLVFAGKLFPFCFITIACGSISGFHSLIASGTTPKILTRESYARPVGYGAMCLESLVAIMALIAACTLEPGVYLSMNVPATGATPAAIAANTVAKVQSAGFQVTPEQMSALADEMHEKTLYGRTGGAATLAVGMANIFSQVTHGRWLGLWYHFAIMFEALFILTTMDAGTRVGRYLVQDLLGTFWKPLGNTRNFGANLLASGLIVAGWGYFLIQGVRDPLGGINSLWPIFGIANQLLATIALCLATTVILKMQLRDPAPAKGRPMLAWVTLGPLLVLLTVTMTAGLEKIFHADPRIGFLSGAKVLDDGLPALQAAVTAAQSGGVAATIQAAEVAWHTNRVKHFNAELDAVVTGFFLVLVTAIMALSLWSWIGLLRRRGRVNLQESPTVWLPGYAVAESRPVPVVGLLALGFGLARELSGEAQLDRAQRLAVTATCGHPEHAGQARHAGHEVAEAAGPSREQLYMEVTERRFQGVNRCC